MKKVLIFFILFFVGIITVLGIVGCNGKNNQGTNVETDAKKNQEIPAKSFYSLQEAYDNGWLVQEDLKSIAELVNTDNSLSIDKLNDEILAEIIDSYTALHHVESDTVVIMYYGNFNNYYAVDISISGAGAATVIREVNVGGVKFEYPNSAAEVVIFKVK